MCNLPVRSGGEGARIDTDGPVLPLLPAPGHLGATCLKGFLCFLAEGEDRAGAELKSKHSHRRAHPVPTCPAACSLPQLQQGNLYFAVWTGGFEQEETEMHC